MRLFATALTIAVLAGWTGMALAAENNQFTGPVTQVQATPVSDAEIRQILEAEGYANVQIKERDNKRVEVTATKDGRTSKLSINPQTGEVQSDSDDDD
jgi:hypothetical protein